jgi:UMF1 family MFS transporter
LRNPVQKEEGSIICVFKEKKFIFTIISILSLTEVANTLIAMMSIYLKKVYGFEDLYIYKIIGFSAIGGIIGGFLWGKITDIFSAKKIFPIGFFLWISFLIFLPLAPAKLVLLVGLSAGFALAHLWTTSRILILEEFPEGQASLRFSFLSLTERIASTTGLFTLSLFLWLTSDNFRLSAFLMVVFPLIGLYFFYVARNKAS